MKKLIFGAMTALLISGSAFANTPNKVSSKVEATLFETYCRITVITRNPNGTVKSSTTTYYPVSSGAEGVKQCNAIKSSVEASLAAN